MKRVGIGGEHLLFLGRFLRNPRTIGSFLPSSRFLARRMVAGLELRAGGRVVELGPGTGAFTGAIAAILPPDGRYLGIEREAAFMGILRTRWPQLEYVCDSVVNLVSIIEERGLMPLDHIVCGLPFASLPGPVTLRILDAVSSALRPGGTFTTFQYIHAYYAFPAARTFRREMRARLGDPTRAAVLRNVPPAFVLRWRKAT